MELTVGLPARICHLPRRDGALPEGVSYVGRPHQLANPFKMGEPLAFAISASAHLLEGQLGKIEAATRDEVVAAYRLYLHAKMEPGRPETLKNKRWRLRLAKLSAVEGLACACPLGEPCHVDVLIELIVMRPWQDK